jgi:hypothetical protein
MKNMYITKHHGILGELRPERFERPARWPQVRHAAERQLYHRQALRPVHDVVGGHLHRSGRQELLNQHDK